MALATRGLGRGSSGAVVAFGLGRNPQDVVVEPPQEAVWDTTQGSAPIKFFPVVDVTVQLTKTFGAKTATSGIAGVDGEARATRPVVTEARDTEVWLRRTGVLTHAKPVEVVLEADVLVSRTGAKGATDVPVVAKNVQVRAGVTGARLYSRSVGVDYGVTAFSGVTGILAGAREVEVFAVINPSDEELIAAYLAARRRRLS